jgi:formylglycine-generating enzyme required for sulfatase activity
LGLIDILAALRRGRGLSPGKKVLLVLDQFEQWLHAKRAEEDAELVRALRQCDGGRVQGVVLVRDDFWMAATRFMAYLEVPLLQGENSAAVDLFDPRHARKVLAAFGRAFGALPESLSRDEDAFLDQAVAGLSQDGKVIPVRLALFAETVKGRPWSPATLREVGGTAGVGVRFLEETFSASTAPPTNRLHQKAARSVLKALLPESGTDIKGTMQSRDELLAASGYAGRPQDFAELLRILDGQLRLVTPTDPEGVAGDGNTGPPPAGGQFYQLTHDYLVHSLRDWLVRKQKETRRGRAELRLAERSASWNAKPQSRHLPAWWEWATIRLLTRKQDWTPPQQRMMRQAGRFHVVRGLALLLLALLLGWAGYAGHGRLRAQALVESLVTAETGDVPRLVGELEGFRRWADPRLVRHVRESPEDAKEHLHASLALLPVDGGQVEYLYGRLLQAGPVELPVIRDALLGHRDALTSQLWAMLEDGKGDSEQRFRASCALAAYDATEGEANRERWEGVTPFVADWLLAAVQRNPSHYDRLRKTLEPVGDRLLDPLAVVFRSGERAEADRTWASSVLAEYAADRPGVLTGLLLDADAKQFAVLYPKVAVHRERAVALCQEALEMALDKQKTEPDKERLAKRQANAGAALLRLGQPDKVWPLLKHSLDPRVRSYLIHRLGPLGADAGALARRLEEEPDVTIRRALILSLGPEEFGEPAWTAGEKEVLVERMRETYRTAADPGLHAAAEWLLRQWQQGQWLGETDAAWAKDKEGRQRRLDDIKKELRQDKERAKPRWYVNGQGQTMVVIPGPVEFLMGSPPTEAGRGGDEGRHRRKIGRTFAIAAKAVTVKEFLPYYKRRFGRDYDYLKERAPSEDCPVHGTTWHMAAGYCNWLSGQEGIPETQWCYETDGKGRVTKLREKYLSLEGYRLATEAEWEYACRAGALTARYYGESEDLLPKYGWYAKNAAERSWPVGLKKPNDLGLFDLHGVYTWCQESYRPYPGEEGGRAVEDKEGNLDIKVTDSRVLRGGSFDYQASFARSALRYWKVPTPRSFNVGCRPARTFR